LQVAEIRLQPATCLLQPAKKGNVLMILTLSHSPDSQPANKKKAIP
jgi:hypothetical protein